MNIYTGIDPGSQGGVCEVHTFESREPFVYIHAFSKKDQTDLIPLIRRANNVWMEKVSNYPGQGGTAIWSFARETGKIEGRLLQENKQINYVLPQEWQKELGLLGCAEGIEFKNMHAKKSYRKKKYQEYAINTFPQYEKQITLEVADSVCIAIYAMRKGELDI